MVTSFANAMFENVEDVMRIIGHDGSEIIFDNLPEPMCRRGHHIQECIRAAIQLGWYATPIELIPQIAGTGSAQVFTLPDCWELFEKSIRTKRGVIECLTKRCRHAVAFRYGEIIDPDTGNSYPYSREAVLAHGLITHKLWILR